MKPTLQKIANVTLVSPLHIGVYEVRQGARYHNCGVRGNNTYQIVYTGNFDAVMDGARVL